MGPRDTQPSAGDTQVAKPVFLVLSDHNYRSLRRANIHFITRELARLGTTRFFSLRYSQLSRYTQDQRLAFDDEANQVRMHGGVECYLWKTLFHPFNTRRPWLRPIENLMFSRYSQGHDPVLRRWIREANVILLESGVAPIFFELIKQLNPAAQVLYRASDALDTINVADYVVQAFARAAPQMDTIALPSKALAEGIPSRHNLAFVPHGIDHALAQQADPSPYGDGIHAVSVGSMLFDPEFFVLASRRFPAIQFHVIGSGHPRQPAYRPNVHLYTEMPFAQTLPHIKHAQLGIAPYVSANLPVYLRDTSMKLIQYAFFGVPAICPHLIAAGYANRFGYEPGDENSIAQAIERALHPAQPIRYQPVLTWEQVTQRMLRPRAFADTQWVA